MISKTKLLNLLQVRQTEWWLVRQLFFQQFFSGAGIALFFTAAFSWFLQKFSIVELPKVLIASAFVLWITGFIYSKLEHAFRIKYLILYINLFIALSILAFRAMLPFTGSVWFYFAMLVWYNVLYLLNSLDFWGLASLLFDVRQSKRLFGLISAGDIPAKFIGYSSAVIIVPFLGAQNLLVVGAILVLISLRYWYRLNKYGHLNVVVAHAHRNNKAVPGESLKQIVKNFFQNNLVFHMAILSFLIMSTFTVINFTFYAEVKNRLTNNAMLATYIGWFLAFSRGVAIVVKLFFTNRIINYLGITKALLITPVLLSLLFIPVFLMQLSGVGTLKVLLVFGLLSILNDVLRSAIQTPVFLAIMQPLQANVRLRAHNILKGIMDPFAFFFCGVFLYLMIDLEHFVDLQLLCYLLTALLFLSICWILIIDKAYIKALIIAVHNRYLNNKDANINDATTLSFLTQRMPQSSENDALVILSLIKELQPSTYKILKQALNHTAMPVQFEAVKLSQRLHAHELLADISQVAATTQSIALKQRCITAIYALSRNNITQLSWHKEQQWQIASLKGMLGNELLQHEAHKQLHVLFTQGKQSLIAALTIVQQSGNTHFSNEVMEALQSTDEEILALAINAAGVCHRAEIVHKLISLSEQTKYTASVMKSLSMQGGAAVKLIAEAISSKTLSLPTQKKLIAVIAKANHTYSVPVLTTLANERTPLLHDIVFSLYVLGYKSAQTDKQFLQIIDNKFLFASMLISQIQQVAMQQNKLLHNALTIELNDVRSQLLYMFTFFYNTENILRVKHAYVIDKPNVIANAMEVIDVTLNKSHAQKFIALFDNVSIETKLNEMQKYFHVQLQPQTVIKQILNAPEDTFNSWTKAVAVYTLSKDQTTHYNLRLKQIMTHADRLLQQTIVHKLQAIAH